jgi:ribosomal protein L37AE/L43A
VAEFSSMESEILMTNKYPGKCQICGSWVAKFSGILIKVGGKYAVQCSSHGVDNNAVHPDSSAAGANNGRPVCPDCGGQISAWALRKGYHCDSCTQAIEGPAYYDNQVSYADDGGNW